MLEAAAAMGTQAALSKQSQGGRPRPGVLMVISHFPPTIGGTERQARALAAGLAAVGHRITILTLAQPGVPARETLEDVTVERTLTSRGRGLLFALTYTLSVLREMRRLRAGHAILHAHHLYLEAMAAAWVGHRTGFPAIAKMACGGSDGDFARLRRTKLIHLLPLLRRLQRVVAISTQTEAELAAHGFPADCIARIPNGVDPIRFAPASDPAAIRAEIGVGAETVLFLGRLDAQKGLDVLLRAWDHVVGRRPTARLLLAGEGPARGALEAHTRDRGLDKGVRFLGGRPDPEALLQASQIFVLPSRSEGMSNALLEAMATGLPCVASHIGGNTDLIEHGVTGLLTPPGDAATLAEVVSALFEDRALRERLGAAARGLILERYAMDRVIRQYAELYATLTG